MSSQRTLWEFLDTAEPGPKILDTADEDVEVDYFTKPATRTTVRWRVAATAGVGLALGIVVIAVGAYMYRSSAVSLNVVATEDDSSARSPGGETGQSATAVPETSPALLVLIHVVGAVISPGVVEVPADSRVLDAINKAGGASEDAALEGVNLARIVFDGEQIVVPREGEVPSGAGGGVGGGAPGGPAPLVSLSNADSQTLQTLPRVGPATAERIIAWRTAHGPFRSVEDLLAISGIGPATVEAFRDLVVP
jgi:competence protein ComEA